MPEPRHELRYADRESAYCICGGWHHWVPDYQMAYHDDRMALIEEAFQEHAAHGVLHVTLPLTDLGGRSNG